MNLKAGTRVYIRLVHETTGEEKRCYGTLDRDEEIWDYSDVRFDDLPDSVLPIPIDYLFSDTPPEAG